MKINQIEKILGSGFLTGYIPFASGTFGSLAAVLIYLIPGFENLYVILPFTILFLLIGFPIATKFEGIYGKDPSQCTIDEIVGTWISLILIPKNIWYITIAFVIWRMLDILKPYPANKIERIKGGVGIMMDDVIAGFYSLIFIHIIILIINNFNIL